MCCESTQLEECAGCLKILRDCADICALVSQMIARNSVNAKLICSFCANICDACAKACENARILAAKSVLKFVENVPTLAVKLAVANEVKFP